MNKPLYCFVGPSGSGKTSVVNALEDKYGYKSIQSYTTRKPRHDGEVGHTFISESDFDELKNIVAYTEYNGFRYCATEQQLDEADLYVVDIDGIESLLEKYNNQDRLIVVIYLDTTVYTRINRMIDRGDSDMRIVSRLLQDEKDDWYRKLDALVWHHENINGKNVHLHTVNANGNQTNVLEMVLYYMKQYMEE